MSEYGSAPSSGCAHQPVPGGPGGRSRRSFAPLSMVTTSGGATLDSLQTFSVRSLGRPPALHRVLRLPVQELSMANACPEAD